MNVYLLFSFVSFIIYLQAALFIFFVYARSRTNLLFVAGSLALGIHSLSYFLTAYLPPLSDVLYAERWAGISFIASTLIFNVLIFHLNGKSERLLKPLLDFVLLPLAITIAINLFIYPDAFSYFYLAGGHWQPSSSANFTLWDVVFALYSIMVISLAILQAIMWRIKCIEKREKMRSGIVLSALVFFIAFIFITDFILPQSGILLGTPIYHFAGLLLMAAFFYMITNLDFNPFSEKIVSNLFVNQFRVFVLFFDQAKHLYAASQHALNNLGYKKYELIDLGAEGLFDNQDIYQRLLLTDIVDLTKGDFIIPLKKKDGTSISVRFKVVEIFDSVGKPAGFVLSGYDHGLELRQAANVEELNRQIMLAAEENSKLEMLLQRRIHEIDQVKNRIFLEDQEKKRASHQIKHIAREKQDLVGEMHHRVKNNLQVALSLTEYAGSDSLLDEEERAVIKSIARYIRTLSIIHEGFYSSAQLSKINFGGYLKTLISYINRNNYSNSGVLFRINSGDEFLHIKPAIVCGLIVYELVTNALEHAFPSDSYKAGQNTFVPIIVADFYRNQQWFDLVIRDNGRGINEETIFEKHSGAGMKIIKILVEEQLQGEFSAVNSFGTYVRIHFPAGGS